MDENRVRLVIQTEIDRALMDQTEKIIGAVGQRAQKTEKSIGGIGNSLKRVAMMAATYFTADRIMKGIDLASDFTENRNKMEAVFAGQIGDVDAFIDDMADTLRLGRPQLEKEFADMGAVLKGQGFKGDFLTKNTSNMVAAAKDIASFYNTSLDEAMKKLQSGITGESEPLKALGINIQDNEMEAFAGRLGYIWKELDNTAKSQLRMNAIIDKMSLAGAVGDAKRTNEEFAGTKRSIASLTEEITGGFFKEMKDSVAPVMNQFANYLKDNKESMMSMGSAVGEATTKFISFSGKVWDGIMAVKDFLGRTDSLASLMSNGLLTGLVAVAGAVGTYNAAMGVIGPAIKAFSAAQAILNGTMVLNPIGLVVVGVVALAAGFIYAYNKSETFREGVHNLWDKVKGMWSWLQEFDLGEFLTKTFEKPISAIESLWDKLKGMTSWITESKAFKTLGNLFGGDKNIAVSEESKTITGAIPKEIPQFAKGTSYAPGGAAIVGENGPELINLPKGSEVMSNNKTRDLGGKTDMTLNFTINATDFRSLAKDIESSVKRIVRDHERKKLAVLGV